MRVAQKFAGYSLAEADLLRRACGKKKRELIAKERRSSSPGASHRLRRRARQEVVRHHRAVRRLRLQQVARFRLRLHRLPDRLPQGALPGRVPGGAAHQREGEPRQGGDLPRRVPHDGHRGARARREPLGRRLHARRRGRRRRHRERSIVFGLSAVRNVGAGLVGLLVAEREANGPFADFYDFCERVDYQVLNKKTIESLIKAGAFDSLGHPRQGLLAGVRADHRRHRRPPPRARHGRHVAVRRAGTTAGRVRRAEPIPRRRVRQARAARLREGDARPLRERPPAHGRRGGARRRCDGTLAELAEIDDGTIRTFGGVVTGLQRKWTKKGDLMAVFVLEDLQTAVEVMVFPQDDDRPRPQARRRRGRGREGADRQAGGPAQADRHGRRAVRADGAARRSRCGCGWRRHALSEPLIDELKRLLAEHPGDSQVLLHLGERQVLRLPEAWTVDVSARPAGRAAGPARTAGDRGLKASLDRRGQAV